MTLMAQRSLRRLLGCLVVLVPLVAAPGARAAGGSYVSGGGASPLLAMAPHTSCQSEGLETPFTSWGDDAYYFLIRQGDVGSADNWDLYGATVAAENNAYTVYTDPPASVSVADGQSATSPSVCVNIDDPTLRFFVRNTGAATGLLHVDVLYQDDYGNEQTAEIATLGSSTPSSWGPSPIIDLTVPLVDVMGDGFTPVQFSFRADGDGSAWLLDDVYVDPYGKG
jgi:hypothetical protein